VAWLNVQAYRAYDVEHLNMLIIVNYLLSTIYYIFIDLWIMSKRWDMLSNFLKKLCCWFYNVLMITNFKLHDANFIGLLSYI
jgi:hypothetical protein